MRRGGELDGARVLAPRTVELMTTNQVDTLHSTTGLGFGYGFQSTTDTGRTVWIRSARSAGAAPTARRYRVDPKSRLVIVMMIQVVPQHRRRLPSGSTRRCIRRLLARPLSQRTLLVEKPQREALKV